jgi:hypothetical protein
MSFEDKLRKKIDDAMGESAVTQMSRDEFYTKWLQKRGSVVSEKFRPVCPLLRERGINASCEIDTANYFNEGCALLRVHVGRPDGGEDHALKLAPDTSALEIKCSAALGGRRLDAEWTDSYPLEALSERVVESIVEKFTVAIVNYHALHA